jgi:predicted nucleotidyltransferase
MAYKLTKEISDIIHQYNEALVKDGILVKDILVFGSHAKGTQKPWSDIDVAVISPLFGKDTLKERNRLMRLRRRVSTSIEPHPLHPEDLENKWSTLAQEIKKYGISID